MQDEETRSWWQQVTGEAILGPLAGRRLDPVAFDEITFGLFQNEHPDGRVLHLDRDHVGGEWEAHVGKLPVVTKHQESDALEPRAIVIGVSLGGEDVAYPRETLQRDLVIQDSLGGVPIVLVLGADGRSARAFARDVAGRPLDLYLQRQATPPALIDADTGSTWDFRGHAIAGP